MLPAAETMVGVLGAGAMGAGIAQIAAMHGHSVVLADAVHDAIGRAREGHTRAMTREVEKGRITRDAADAVLHRLTYVHGMGETEIARFAPCALVVEAIVENLQAKQELFGALDKVVHEEALLATNTSSLSVAAVGSACAGRERVIGMHFFNPAPVMPLVEIVPALTTNALAVETASEFVRSWGKTAICCADTPGFVVNRIARPFYGESLRLVEEGISDVATIDWAMRTFGGFKMGPFELMDFIGNDVNYAATCSIFEAMFYDSRYRPSLLQRRLVEAGRLGRKTQRGYYDYRDGATNPAPKEDAALGKRLVDRVLAMLVNEAVHAVYLRVASSADIELAMTKGVNYPKGLLAWGDEIGAANVHARLLILQETYGEERYRPSPLLSRLAKTDARILA